MTQTLSIQDAITHSVDEAIAAAQTLKCAKPFIEEVAMAIADCFKRGNKIIVAGNGGSLCDAMHFVEEMTGYFRRKRKALPAIALADPGHMSCVGNDTGYDDVFSRGVEAHGVAGDVFIALTTSGNSPNLVQAVEVAKANGLTTVAFLGKTGGKLKDVCDHEWVVSGFPYSDRVQEAHMAAIHIIIEMIEKVLFD
ncbi:MAG: SIS domain-containing protein [Chlamydiia bacterium]|nr:SIS domain-containing protein [Chlamydiia bacterium]MCP5492089.1 SIS domain-containing protein [Chlamydiales bacterium]